MQGCLRWVALVVAAASWGARAPLSAQQSGVKPPRKIRDVKPEYPAQSLSRGDEGAVIIELKVDSSGAVADARVLWSKCPPLNAPALKAVRGWQFEKILINGEPTAFTVTTQVPFRLPARLKSRAGGPGACRWIDPPKPIF
jgi:periplasmic protein TonB